MPKRNRSIPATPGDTEINPALLPTNYGMRLTGACLEPELSDGSVIAVTAAERPRSGDMVVAWLRPHAREAWNHQAIIKRLVMMQRPGVARSNIAPCVVLEQLNPPRFYTLPWDDVEALHKCLGPAESAGDPSPEGLARVQRPQARAAAGAK